MSFNSNFPASLGIEDVFREAILPVSMTMADDAVMPTAVFVQVFYREVLQPAVVVPVSIVGRVISFTFTVPQLRDMVGKKAYFFVYFDGKPVAGNLINPKIDVGIPEASPNIVVLQGFGSTRVVFTGDLASVTAQAKKAEQAALDAETFRDEIIAALASIGSPFKYQGLWDASTNNPNLPALGLGNTEADRNKCWYNNKAGTNSITGVSVDWLVGDMPLWNGLAFEQQKRADIGLETALAVQAELKDKANYVVDNKVVMTPALVNAEYVRLDTGAFGASGSYHRIAKFSVLPGETYYFTGTVSGKQGGSTPFAGVTGYDVSSVFKTTLDGSGIMQGNLMGNDRYALAHGTAVENGLLSIVDEPFVIPAWCYYIVASSRFQLNSALVLKKQTDVLEEVKDRIDSVDIDLSALAAASNIYDDITGPKLANSKINSATGVATTTAATGYEMTDWITVFPGETLYLSGAFDGLRGSSSPILIGATGYTTNTEASFVSTLDASGMPIGQLMDVNRYIQAVSGSLYGTPAVRIMVDQPFVVPATVTRVRAASFVTYSSGFYPVVVRRKRTVTVIDGISKDININNYTYTDISGTKTSGYINTYNGSLGASAAYHNSEFIKVKKDEVYYFTGLIRGIHPTGPSGVAGYKFPTLTSGFNSDLDGSGLFKGSIVDIDRYCTDKGIPIVAGDYYFTRYPFVIKDGINWIRGSSRFDSPGKNLIIEKRDVSGSIKLVDFTNQLAKDTTTALFFSQKKHYPRIVVCHRGLKLNFFPENSLDSYEAAARAGYKIVETDVSFTSDGKPFMLHDDTLNRTMNLSAGYTTIPTTVPINTVTAAQLRSDYVLISSTIRFRRVIPSLEEFCTLCRDLKVHPLIELKSPFGGTNFNEADIIWTTAASILGETGFTMTCFNIPMLDYIRNFKSKLTQLNYLLEDVDKIASYYGTVYFQKTVNLTPAVIARAKQLGVKVGCWYTNPGDYDVVTAMGVDEMATDYDAPDRTTGTVINAVHSDGVYTGFTLTSCTVTNGICAIANGGTIVCPYTTVLYLGAMYMQIKIKGKALVNGPAMGVTIENLTDDWKIYRFQLMFAGVGTSYTITGVTSAQVADINYEVVKF